MPKKKDDDVKLPEDPKTDETPVETPPKPEPESVDGGTPPPAEDVQELPDEDEPSELGPPPIAPDADPVAAVQNIHEKVKIFQNRDVAALEKAYADWTESKAFARTGGGIRERHIADGGNGLLHLAIFYVD